MSIRAVPPARSDQNLLARLAFLEQEVEQLERAHPQTRVMVTLTPVDPAPEGTLRLGDNGTKRAASWMVAGSWRYTLLA